MNLDDVLIHSAIPYEQRQRLIMRNVHILDIKNAMEKGFKAEPDLAPHHLPLLSDDALERIFNESEKWRDKAHERALEQTILDKQDECNELNDRYVALREIIGAMFVPDGYHRDDSDRYFRWTEKMARELVAKADASDRNRQAAEDAEHRVNLLERYVKACDDKRLPYNWNVFKLPNAALRDLVWEHESRERLTNIATSAEDAHWFETRKAQETEQSLRWHVKRHEAVRQIIHRMNNNGEILVAKASELMDALLDRPQTGEQTQAWNPAWTTWEWGYEPKDITRDTKLELRLKSGDVVILDSSVVEWADVEAYRPAK